MLLRHDRARPQYKLDLISLDESLVYGEGLFGAAIWGWKDLVAKELLINRRCKRAALYLSDDSVGEPLVIYGAAFYCKYRKVKGDRSGSARVTVDYED